MNRLWIALVMAASMALPVPVLAADHAITGGSNGSSCNSGGYFTPSSLTVTSGDTVTISVPSNDPYAWGLDVIGFPEGTFTIARGGSHKTAPLTANVSYHGTWPSAPGCPKGTGAITVSAAATPAPTPAPTQAAHAVTPTPKAATPSPTASSKPQATVTPKATKQPSASPTPTSSAQPVAAMTNKSGGPPTMVLGAALGGTVLFVVLGLLGVRIIAKRRLNSGVTTNMPTNPPSNGPTS